MSDALQLKKEMKKLANPEAARNLQWYFKTGKGEYGEGDVFLGINLPTQRKLAKKYEDLPLAEIELLLKSKIHEHRLTALIILVGRYQKADKKEKERVFKLYLRNAKRVNNWDLVDTSAPKIVGQHLLDKPRDLLYKLAKSKNLWERRIAIMSTMTFIGNNDFKDTLKISEMLLDDSHDLIHKAVGWMLREVGKQSQAAEEEFLKKHCQKMPRTMLRYAIEKFDGKKRKFYLERKA